MNTLAIRKLREKLAAGQAVYGLWVTLESASVTEMAVALGLDWVVIDAEHGQLDWKEIVEHLRAAVRSETVALVRIAELDRGLIKRALDIGADGIVVPWMETEDQLRQAVAFARYPPEGCRGIGGERATGWGECLAEHTAEANEHVLVVPIIESVRAVAAVPRMCQVEGVEVFFFGPADFSSTAGFRGQWEGPGVARQILELQGRHTPGGQSIAGSWRPARPTSPSVSSRGSRCSRSASTVGCCCDRSMSRWPQSDVTARSGRGFAWTMMGGLDERDDQAIPGRADR